MQHSENIIGNENSNKRKKHKRTVQNKIKNTNRNHEPKKCTRKQRVKSKIVSNSENFQTRINN